MPLREIAVVVPPQPAAFELAVLLEVFGVDRTDGGVPAFDLRVCAPTPGRPLPMRNGLTLTVPHGLDGLAGADVVAVPACQIDQPFSAELLEAVRAAYAAGATVLSVCSGVFVVAEAGIVGGQTVACHWYHADELARRHPELRIDPDVLFVDEGRLITSAGTAAGIDACLHLVRRELGADVATKIARRMVVPPHRDGGQRQFVELPIPPCRSDSLAPLLAWLTEHLDESLTVPDLARRALLSERTFARRFAAETGTTPARWIALQRLLHAQRLLEQSDLTVDQIAQRCGFGGAALLRQHFARQVGISPGDYRRAFRAAPERGERAS